MLKRAILLAAGQGNRLRPLTDDRPKCMVELAGKPLLHWQLQSLREAGVEEVSIVLGYCKEAVPTQHLQVFENPNYATTNMVQTLWCAEKAFEDGFILSYTDIVYNASVAKKLATSPHEISVVIDLDWLTYWRERFTDVLSDAESLRLDAHGCITDIGRKEQRLEDIQGQYIGLLAFQKSGVSKLREFYSGRDLSKLYMTDVLRGLIQMGAKIHAVSTHGEWLEIDSLKDLEVAKRFAHIQAQRLSIRRSP